MNKKQIDKEIRKIFQKCLDLQAKGTNIDFHFSASTQTVEIIKFNKYAVAWINRCYVNPDDVCFDKDDFRLMNYTLDEQFRKVEEK